MVVWGWHAHNRREGVVWGVDRSGHAFESASSGKGRCRVRHVDDEASSGQKTRRGTHEPAISTQQGPNRSAQSDGCSEAGCRWRNMSSIDTNTHCAPRTGQNLPQTRHGSRHRTANNKLYAAPLERVFERFPNTFQTVQTVCRHGLLEIEFRSFLTACTIVQGSGASEPATSARLLRAQFQLLVRLRAFFPGSASFIRLGARFRGFFAGTRSS